MSLPEVGVSLSTALRQAVLAQDFGATPDHWRSGAPVAHFPSIDLAVAAFRRGRPAVWANVLFSREHPQGMAGDMGADAGALRQVRFDRDVRDKRGESVAWLPDADWRRIAWQPLAGNGTQRFVAPYPASLLKLMVAVGVGMAVDRGLADWPPALEPMITVSDNDATTACVALLHRLRLIDSLNARFAALGLTTLQMHGTQANGGWRNADGAGVGQIHMTAWDTVRLLWLLDAQAPPPPWLSPSPQAGTALLSDASRAHLRGVLQRQQLDHILSSGSLRDVPSWLPGLPDAPAFAHKTGNTDNYASDAGIVMAGDTHYIVALLTSLGKRHAPDERCATTWRLPALGAAVHQLMEQLT